MYCYDTIGKNGVVQMDVLTKEQRHKAMSHIRSKDTSIEVKLRKALWHKGSNAEFWEKKILRNMERDDEINKTLTFMGWTVIRFWGCDIKKDVEECIAVIEECIFDLMIGSGDDAASLYDETERT